VPTRCGQAPLQCLHSARIILPCLGRCGTQHSGFNDIKCGAAHKNGDDNPCYDSRTFAWRFFGMVKLSQTAHPYLLGSPALGRFVSCCFSVDGDQTCCRRLRRQPHEHDYITERPLSERNSDKFCVSRNEQSAVAALQYWRKAAILKLFVIVFLKRRSLHDVMPVLFCDGRWRCEIGFLHASLYRA